MGADEQADYGLSWHSGVTPLPPPRKPLSYDLDVEVCVVGGGLAGLTVAREVARRGWSVAVVEARRLAWNASGRNSGLVMPGFSARIERVIERIGLPAAKALWELSEAGVQYVRDTIAQTGLAGIHEGTGGLDVSRNPDAGAARRRVGLLGQEMGIAVEFWPAERVREVLRTGDYFHAVHFPDAFQINPLAYALGLADAAERAGAHIFENSPVRVVDRAGVRKRIETPNGRVRAGHVVLAGNVHLGAVAQSLADTLVPITGFTGVTQPLGVRLAAAVTFHGAVTDSRYATRHYRIVGGDRLLWTGGASAGRYGLTRMKRRLEAELRTIYPELWPVEFERFWPAEMGFAVHRMPQIGEVEPAVWLAGAFGGQGLNTSAIAGDLIARAVVERDDTWRRFLPFELVWAGGRVGRAGVGAALWGWRQSEAATALAAQWREKLRRKRMQKAAGLTGMTPQPAGPEGGSARIAPQNRTATGEFERPIGAPEATPAATERA